MPSNSTVVQRLRSCLLIVAPATLWCANCTAEKPASDRPRLAIEEVPIRWTGSGKYRVLIAVSPVALRQRNRDELPADLEIDWSGLLAPHGIQGKANIASLQIVRVDATSGQPFAYGNYAHGQSPFDRPYCWYDAAIPYEFPEVFGPLSYSDGQIKRTNSPRAGYMYNAIGDWKRGRLAFSHTQDEQHTSYYVVYFDTLPSDHMPRETAPRSWLGDGMPRRGPRGESTTGADATKIALDDWNGDGLVDIVYGEQYGQLFVMPNTGTRERPEFSFTKMLFDADAKPIDVGIHAAVLVVDWDGDGAQDVLVGTYQNRVAVFKNLGTDRERKLAYRGLLTTADGKALALPIRPVAAKPEGVFRHDYFPVMSAADWNNDGRLDLIAGGYVTGRIYWYENTAKLANGMPALELRGPITADGKPINVRDWCAAPCVADFNGDGKLDLISGSYTWLPQKKERPSFLRFYENIGTRSKPAFTERPFPFAGKLRTFRLPVPRATDWNHDGLIDLVVSSGADIYLFPNVGTTQDPVFQIDGGALPTAWGIARLPGRQFIDFNGDGLADLVSGYSVHLNSGAGNPYRFDETVPVLPEGVFIDHPVETGDGHFWPYLSDLDQDGKIDVLFGDWHGHVWFHRNQSSAGERRFDVAGHRLRMKNDRVIKVGPLDGDTQNNFQALQGARTVFTVADYDSDGRNDLVVGDTYGKIRYFRNLGPQDDPRFALPESVGDMGVRLLVEAVDWNDDGKMDVIAGAANHRVSVFLNTGDDGKASFDKGQQLAIPKIKQNACSDGGPEPRWRSGPVRDEHARLHPGGAIILSARLRTGPSPQAPGKRPLRGCNGTIFSSWTAPLLDMKAHLSRFARVV